MAEYFKSTFLKRKKGHVLCHQQDLWSGSIDNINMLRTLHPPLKSCSISINTCSCQTRNGSILFTISSTSFQMRLLFWIPLILHQKNFMLLYKVNQSVDTASSETSQNHGMSSGIKRRNMILGNSLHIRDASRRFARSFEGKYSITISLSSSGSRRNGSEETLTTFVCAPTAIGPRMGKGLAFILKVPPATLLMRPGKPGMSIGLAARYSQPGSCSQYCS